METIDSIEAAIRRLPWQHRTELLERLHDIAMEVREPAAAYRGDPPSDQSFRSPEEYLEHEARSEIRHEYVSGVLYALSGASEPELFYQSRSEGWRPRRLSGLDATLELRSIKLALPLTEIYDRAL